MIIAISSLVETLQSSATKVSKRDLLSQKTLWRHLEYLIGEEPVYYIKIFSATVRMPGGLLMALNLLLLLMVGFTRRGYRAQCTPKNGQTK